MRVRIPIFFLLFFNICTALFAQQQLRFGLSLGTTISFPKVTHKESDGKVTPGYGLDLYFPLSYQLDEKLSLESGLGYATYSYRVSYNNSFIVIGSGSAFFPIKLTFTKPISEHNKLYASLGVILQTGFVRGFYDFKSVDSVAGVVMAEHRVIKTYSLVNLEFGYRRITRRNKVNQISLQLFYGFQKQSDGEAYRISNPSSTFNYIDKSTFVILQYTFWFGKRPKQVSADSIS